MSSHAIKSSPVLLGLLVLMLSPLPSSLAQENQPPQIEPQAITADYLSSTTLSMMTQNISSYYYGSDMIFPSTFDWDTHEYDWESYRLTTGLIATMGDIASFLQLDIGETAMDDTFVEGEDEALEFEEDWQNHAFGTAGMTIWNWSDLFFGDHRQWAWWADNITAIVELTGSYDRRFDDSKDEIWLVGPPMWEWLATLALRQANSLFRTHLSLVAAQTWTFLRAIRVMFLKEKVSVAIMYTMLYNTDPEVGAEMLKAARQELKDDVGAVVGILKGYYRDQLDLYADEVFRVRLDQHGCLGRYYIEMRQDGMVNGTWVNMGEESEACWVERCELDDDEGMVVDMESGHDCMQAEEEANQVRSSVVDEYMWEQDGHKRFLGTEYLAIVDALEKLMEMDFEDMIFDLAMEYVLAREEKEG